MTLGDFFSFVASAALGPVALDHVDISLTDATAPRKTRSRTDPGLKKAFILQL
jgi:hypothetical protein